MKVQRKSNTKNPFEKTLTEVHSEGYRFYLNIFRSVKYPNEKSSGSVNTRLASTRGERRWRSDDSATPCSNCKNLCYSLNNLFQKGGEWMMSPSCIAKRDPEEDVPAKLKTWGEHSKRKCPDFEARDSV